jgi:hypothetical protein
VNTYKTIKWILKKQIEGKAKTLWTWDKSRDENFTCIYLAYNDNLPIYTPLQLLEEIEIELNKIKQNG